MFWRKWLLGFLVLLNLFLGYRLLGEQGIFGYRELKAKYKEMEQKLDSLNKKNMELSQEIRLLKSDRSYIEKVIREQMNFVRQDEILYVFPEKAHKSPVGAPSDEKKN